jgi:osmotically-inducible protein OsmY
VRTTTTQQRESSGLPPDSVVKQALSRSGYGDLRRLDVASVDGRIRVAGRVHSYYMKQKAQTIAMSVMAVGELQNEVAVQ